MPRSTLQCHNLNRTVLLPYVIYVKPSTGVPTFLLTVEILVMVIYTVEKKGGNIAALCCMVNLL